MESPGGMPRRGLRSWWYDDPADLPGRLPADTPQVRRLASTIAPAGEVRDLGGSYSLNLHLVEPGLVLRVHQPFVTRRRLLDLQTVRRHLGRAGVNVPAPRSWSGRTVFRCAGRWGELDAFVAHQAPVSDVAACDRLMWDLGRLDRLLATCTAPVTRPVVATWATPPALRRWMTATRAAVATHPAAAELAAVFDRQVAAVARRWVPLSRLPQQIIHGDGKPDNLPHTAGGDLVALDFGFAARRPRVHDLASAVNWTIHTLGPAVTHRLPAWIDAYEAGNGSRLTPAERDALPALGASIALHRPAVSGYTNDPIGDVLGQAGMVSRVEWWLGGQIP